MKKIVFLLLFSFCFTLLAANNDAKYPEEVQDALKYCEKMGYECEVGEFTNEEPKDKYTITFDDVESFGLDIFENSTRSSAPTCHLNRVPSWFVRGDYTDPSPYGYDYQFDQCAYNQDCLPFVFGSISSGSKTNGEAHAWLSIQENLDNGICDAGSYYVFYRVKEYAWMWVPIWPSGGFWIRMYSSESWSSYCTTPEICSYTGF